MTTMKTQEYLKDIGEKISLLKKIEEVDDSFISDNTKFSLTEIQSILQGTYFDVAVTELKQIISLITGYENGLDELYSIIETIPLNHLLKAYERYNNYRYKDKPLTSAQIWKEKRRTVNDINLCKRCYACKNPLFIKFDEYIEKIIDGNVVYIHHACLENLK